jgi:methyl-accepting chemotaxis protein
MSDDTFKWVIAGGISLAALCFLAQAIAAFILLRTVNKIHDKVEPLADKTEPILEMVRSSMNELVPKLVAVSDDVVELSRTARDQVNRVGELLTDLAQQAKAQVAKIDGAVESTVDSVQHAGESVKDAVLKPVREVNGVLAGIKTAISVYSHGRRQSVDHATQDEEMFI